LMSTAVQHSLPTVAPFDLLAARYDDVFTNSCIGRAQRNLVWREMDRNFQPGQRILEINCGTGVDACHLAERGIRVLACDSSHRMIDVARRRVRVSGHEQLVEVRHLCTEDLTQLFRSEPFEGVLSNFGGLNCLGDLERVAFDLAPLVRTGGRLVICVFGVCCLWETLWYVLRRDLNKAFRRLRAEGDLWSASPAARVVVRYHSVRSLGRAFAPYFSLKRWQGVGIAVPPSYLETLAVRFPRLFRVATGLDSLLAPCPGYRAMADHALLTLERTRA